MNQTYTANIRETRWIDLSEEHQTLREKLEEFIRLSCLDCQDVNPIQLNGAFRIGKSQLLYYLFHYAWSELEIPSFFVKLEVIVKILKTEYQKNNKTKILKEEVKTILDHHFKNELLNLSVALDGRSNSNKFHLPDLKDNETVADYFNRLGAAVHISTTGKEKPLKAITAERVKKVLEKETRYLLLVDEFEEAYHKINEVVESTGGGAFRQFFEDVAKCHANFYMVIACGPASSYKIKSDVSQGSIAAQTGRIQNLQIPFPSVKNLQETFLKGAKKGYANFIWWLSRRRPGWIKKLTDELNESKMMTANYDQFIQDNRNTFDSSIDALGEAGIHILKYSFFQETFTNTDELNRSKNLLLSLQPQPVDLSEWSKFIENQREHIYFAENRTGMSDLLDAMVNDLKTVFKESNQEKEYDPRNLIRIYLRHILSAVSDQDDMLTVGLAEDDNKKKRVTETFLIPILSLLYDFIAEYEDETEDEIRNLLNFIYNLSYSLEKDPNVTKKYKETMKCFGAEDPADRGQALIQLNFKMIRELIQQPVGSPELTFKGRALNESFVNIDEFIPCVYEVRASEYITCRLLLVPNLPESNKMSDYLDNLIKHITEEKNWEMYSLNGSIVTCILFLFEYSHIENFKERLKGINQPHAKFCTEMKKLTVLHQNDISDELSAHISVFLDSLCKIGLISNDSNDDDLIDLNRVLEKIQKPEWQIRKEDRRAISYFKERSLNALKLLADKCVSNFVKCTFGEHLDMDIDKLKEKLENPVPFTLPENDAMAIRALRLLELNKKEDISRLINIMKQLDNMPKITDMPLELLDDLILLAKWVIHDFEKIKQNPMETSFADNLKDFCQFFEIQPSISEPSPLEALLKPIFTTISNKTAFFLRTVYIVGKNPTFYENWIENLNKHIKNIYEIKNRLHKTNAQFQTLLNRDEDDAILNITYYDSFSSLFIPISEAIEKANTNIAKYIFVSFSYNLMKCSEIIFSNADMICQRLQKVEAEIQKIKSEIDNHHKEFKKLYDNELNKKLFLDHYQGKKNKKEYEDFFQGIVLNSFKSSQDYRVYFKKTMGLNASGSENIEMQVADFFNQKKGGYWAKINEYLYVMFEIFKKKLLVEKAIANIDNICKELQGSK